MKTILVPTDFSKNAETALYHAIELAKAEHAQLVLLHAFQANYATSYVPNNVIEQEKTDVKKDSDSLLSALGLKIKHAGNIKYELLSVEDFAVDAIFKIIKLKEIDLIVMGTKGASGFTNKILGSITAKVIRNAECPVLAIPESAKFKAIKNITYTTNYAQYDIEGMQKVADFARYFNAHIQILHITDKNQLPEVEKDLFEKFVKHILRDVDYPNISSRILTGESVEEALDEFVNETATDMLVMTTQPKGFFARLFGESITRHMAYHSAIPLMILHYNETKKDRNRNESATGRVDSITY
ncbi:MAG: universal stress protein [bacterium]|nr:universal stress protein [bacterium]